MTRGFDYYWASNDEWWHVENEQMVVNDDAPEEARKSYEHYLQQTEERKKYI